MIKLALFDIDGTLRQVRSPWRHLHQFLGFSEHAKEFFPMFTRGEITYEKWVELDAALWKGIPKSRILEAIKENPLRQGSKHLVNWLKGKGISCVAISTGLSIFASITKEELGLDDIFCNELLFNEDEICIGKVTINVTEDNKGEITKSLLNKLHLSPQNVISFGDSEADIKMFEATGKSIAIMPTSERVIAVSDLVITEEPIDTCLDYINHLL